MTPGADLIKPARPQDAPAIRACADAAYAPYIPRIGRTPAPMREDYAARIAAGQVHVAKDGTALLGFVVSWPDGRAMLLDNVAVQPARAGRGIGTSLIQHCEDRARRLGLRAVRLYTNALMTENLSIYRHLGYVQIARRWEGGFDRIYLEKPLG